MKLFDRQISIGEDTKQGASVQLAMEGDGGRTMFARICVTKANMAAALARYSVTEFHKSTDHPPAGYDREMLAHT